MDNTLNNPIIYESEAMKAVVKRASIFAPLKIPVLIRGETGVGKEVIAGLIHRLSPRGKRKWVRVNCASVPEALAEGLYFGSVKGSYTHSIRDIEGYFEQADTTTIFLDELPEMGFSIQTKLNHVLQEDGKFRPVGGREERTSDFRLLWATNRDIEEAIEERKLKIDLYHRINEAEIYIPPLRERRDDIIPLARYFLVQAIKDFKSNAESFSDECRDKLLNYDWPANVRQLRNAVRRAAILCEGDEIKPEFLELDYALKGKPFLDLPSSNRLAYVEGRTIVETLKETGGNRDMAAKLLGISRSSLHRRIREYGLSDTSSRESSEQNS